jgi:predicted metal-dependent peptidase
MANTKSNTGNHNVCVGYQRATPQQQAEFCMDREQVRFLFDEPFYSNILRHVSKIEVPPTQAIPWAGVRTCNESHTFEFVWNREGCAALSREELRALLIHECLHLVYNHTTTRRMMPWSVWNWATDLAINSTINPSWLNANWLVPGRPFRALTRDELAHTPPDRIARWNRLSNLLAGLPTHLSAEQYFKLLMEDENAKNDIDEQNSISLEELSLDGDGRLVDKQGRRVLITPGTTDSHDDWGGEEANQETREIMNQRVRDILSDAIRKADSSNQWGTISHEMRAQLRTLVSCEVPWQELLRRFVGGAQSSIRGTTWTRLNKKNPGGATGTKRQRQAKIAVYVDQSASVDDVALGLLMGELEQLSKHADFTFYPFDTRVGEGVDYKRRQFKGFNRKFSGGTDFGVVAAHGDEQCRRGVINGYLIMSDGECYKPAPTRHRRGYVIVPGRKLLFDTDQNEFVIQMKASGKTQIR